MKMGEIVSFYIIRIKGFIVYFCAYCQSCSTIVSCSVSSLRSKRFQSSYCAKVRVEAKKKVEGGGEKRKRLPANPTILENAP